MRPTFGAAPPRYEPIEEARFREQVASAIAKLHAAGADIEIGESRAILTSPDGTRYYFAATDDGLVYLVNVETGVAAELPATAAEIAALDTRVDALEAADIALDGRLDALEVAPVRMKAQRMTSTQALTVGAATVCLFNQEDVDSHSAYNPATGEFTAPTTGWYIVQANVGVTFSGAADVCHVGIQINTNYAYVQSMPIYPGPALYGNIVAVLPLTAGDDVRIVIAVPNGTVGPVLVAQPWSNFSVSSFRG